MEQNENGFYIINPSLTISSGKPYHLEARIRSRCSSNEDYEARKKRYYKSVARREALLEARKEKLMNRRMHVEKVVSAHKKKEAGNSSATLNRIVKNLKAAEEKRIHLLENQKQTYHEQVAHAKKVAQEHQKNLEKDKVLRLQKIEERHQLVANRRDRFFHMPRSRLLDTQSLSLEEITDIEASRSESAVLIQQWYRKLQLQPALDNFKNSGLSLDVAKKMSFEKLVRFMRQEVVTRAGSRLIQRVKKMSTEPISAKNPSRVFLSSYMVASHPESTFPVMTEAEQHVQKVAEAMILDFEALMENTDSSKLFKLVDTFIKSLIKFYQEFDAWKKEDTRKIIDGMIAHWIELEKLWFSVRHTQADAETEWKPKITAQQKSIQSKLAKLDKKAIEKLKEEQAKLRSELDLGDEIFEEIEESDIASSSANESEGYNSEVLSTSPGRFPVKIKARRDSVNSSRTNSPARAASPVAVASATVKQEEKPKVGGSSTDLLADSSFGSFLSNEKLAHELVRDPDFELKPNENKSAMEIQITAIAKKAFFDKVRSDFEKESFLPHVPLLLNDIKSQLLGMLNEKGKLAQEIREHLDIELIEQQIKHNVFNGQQCISYIFSKMSQLCAPIRDQSIRNISNLGDLASMFEQCLNILEEMKLDLINYKLKQLRPVLKEQAVQYEQTKFQEALDSKNISLDKTRAWLETSYKALEKVATARNPENVQALENRVRFEDVYYEGLLKLIFSNKAVSKDTIPETLLLDAERIFKFQNEVQLVSIVSALIMLAKNAVTELRRDRQAVLQLRDRLFILLKDESITIANLSAEIIKSISNSLEAAQSSSSSSPALTPESEQLIKNMVERTLSTKDTLYSLINRRIQGCVLGQLRTGTFKSVTGMSLASAGLDIIEKELMDLSRRISMLAAHNKEVHTKWYDEILKSVSR